MSVKFTKSEIIDLILENKDSINLSLRTKAVENRNKYYGNRVFVRGLIEFTNYCRNNCFYCGIRRDNKNIKRYRLTTDEILACCRHGYELGLRTFVLQGGDDAKISDAEICDTVSRIKSECPDAAVTLSIGEREKDVYKDYFSSGADRYLLRHETANDKHYSFLHPKEMSLKTRKRCLYDLKDIGFQVGAGFMVGSPGQSIECLAEDILFLSELEPHMVGIGPFIPHRDTRYKNCTSGSVSLTYAMLCITRLVLPKVLLPATTALATLDENGRERAFMCGANVVMPNLSPFSVRENYSLYDNKLYSGDETAENIENIKKRAELVGCKIDMSRGDYLGV